MWAQQLAAPGRFEATQAPEPSAGDLAEGEVLLRALAGGVCGSDIPYFRGQLPLPWGGPATAVATRGPGFPMHEVVGEVVASRSDDHVVGSRVVGWAARSDGLAEYVVTAGAGVARFDDALEPTTAVLLQPLACVLDAVARLPDLTGRDVAVLGLGPIGLLFGHVLRAFGADHIRGVDRVSRIDLQGRYGFDETHHDASETWAGSLSDAQRPDIVIEAIGHQQSTLGHAAEAVAPEGVVYYFGIPDDATYAVPMQTLLRKNLTLKTGITVRKRAALADANDYLAKHPELAEIYVTNRFAASDASRAYQTAATPSEGRVKVVIDHS